MIGARVALEQFAATQAPALALDAEIGIDLADAPELDLPAMDEPLIRPPAEPEEDPEVDAIRALEDELAAASTRVATMAEGPGRRRHCGCDGGHRRGGRACRRTLLGPAATHHRPGFRDGDRSRGGGNRGEHRRTLRHADGRGRRPRPDRPGKSPKGRPPAQSPLLPTLHLCPAWPACTGLPAAPISMPRRSSGVSRP